MPKSRRSSNLLSNDYARITEKICHKKNIQYYWFQHPHIGVIADFKPEWLLRLEWLNINYGSPQAYMDSIKR